MSRGAGEDVENPSMGQQLVRGAQARPEAQNSALPTDAIRNLKMKLTLRFGRYVPWLVLIVVLVAIVSSLGVLTAPVSAVVVIAFLITYSLSRPAELLGLGEVSRLLNLKMLLGFTGFAVSLLLSLITLFLVYRFVPSRENKVIVGMAVGKWLEIALISCLFCIIWIGGRTAWIYVLSEYNYKEDLVYFVNTSRWAVNCICFFGAELLVIRVAPGSRDSVVVYGLPIWKWIALVDLVICGCHLIRIGTRLVTVFLQRQQGAKSSEQSPLGYNKYAVFMAKELSNSLNAVLFLVLVLLAWAFYVHSRLSLHGASDDAKKILFYARRTFVAILVGSIFWLLKNITLLLWEAHEVYDRFADRMLKAWMQFYFITAIAGLDKAELVKCCFWGIEAIRQPDEGVKSEDEHVPSGGGTELSNRENPEETKDDTRMQRKTDNAKFRIQQIVDRAKKSLVTYDVLERMCRLLLAAEELWSKKDEKSTDSVLYKISEFRKEWHENTNDANRSITKADLGDKINDVIESIHGQDPNRLKLRKTDFGLLYEQLEDVDQTRSEVHFCDMEKWLIRAYKNCQIVGRTLAGNKEGAVYLNKIFIVATGIAVLIIWLFLVRLATIEFIAAIASPLLAMAFIFKDSAKRLFQGMIFAFGVHPLDVGDICVINIENVPQTLEVNRIGIWKTVFLKEGNKDEEVIYPNSTLADATIVKHKSVVDLTDYLEFSICKNVAVRKTELKNLKHEITKYLEDDTQRFENNSSQIRVLEVGEKVKMGLSFKHLMSFQDMTYLECLKKKNQHGSELLEHITLLVDECEKKVALMDADNQVNRNNDSGVVGTAVAQVNMKEPRDQGKEDKNSSDDEDNGDDKSGA